MKTATKRAVLMAWASALCLVVGGTLYAQQPKTINVSLGGAVTVPATEVGKLAVADPTVADVLPLSDKEISVIGKKAGQTTLTIVYTGDRATEMYLVVVGNDPAELTIRQIVGGGDIKVRAIGDTIVLDGTVEDELQMQRAVQVATAYYAKVVNLLEVRNPRQIRMLTRVVEVNSEAIKNVGLRWAGPEGEVQYALDHTGGGSILHGMIQPQSAGGNAQATPTELDIGLDVILQLLQRKGYARLLSEPTLITLSGQEASFLVGQEVPIVQQLPQSFTVEFKEVGVRMTIKPTADSQNRITTRIKTEVSQVVGTGAFGIPLIGSKKAETTLQLNDGQTLVIGGLLENNITRDAMRKLPWLADIPIFGLLFRHREFSQSQREVLFFLTSEIVKDGDALTANAAQTPVMQDWIAQEATEKLLEKPDPKDDWGLHNPGRMGIPERQPRPAGEGAAEETTDEMEAADDAAKQDPNTNYQPARPASAP
ncbi:pilus assembly protein N-terminal domain-containing protein [bacterium]|nr:pilus assembly protein N-terminal domain-containing protein [bacterium]